MEKIVECAIVAVAVIVYIQFGIFIGRTFGTFEKFIFWHLNRLEKSLKERQSDSISPQQK